MKRIRIYPIIAFSFLVACSAQPQPSSTFPLGKWAAYQGDQPVAVFTFNADHTVIDPQNHSGTWSSGDNKVTIDVPLKEIDQQATNAESLQDEINHPIYKTVTKRDELTVISKTSDTVTITESATGNAATLKYLPPVK